MSCPDEQRLVAYADGELDGANDGAAVEQHLATCSACTAYVAEMRSLTSLGRSSMARIAAGRRPATRPLIPGSAWPRVLIPTLAAAALLLVAALIAARLMTEANDRQQVHVGPTTVATTTTSVTGADVSTASDDDDELFAKWVAACRRTRVPLVPMDEVANFRPPVDRRVTANELIPRG